MHILVSLGLHSSEIILINYSKITISNILHSYECTIGEGLDKAERPLSPLVIQHIFYCIINSALRMMVHGSMKTINNVTIVPTLRLHLISHALVGFTLYLPFFWDSAPAHR